MLSVLLLFFKNYVYVYVYRVCAQKGRCPWRPELLHFPGAGVTGTRKPVGIGNLMLVLHTRSNSLSHSALSAVPMFIFKLMVRKHTNRILDIV